MVLNYGRVPDGTRLHVESAYKPSEILLFRSQIPYHLGSLGTFTPVRISRRSYPKNARRSFLRRAFQLTTYETRAPLYGCEALSPSPHAGMSDIVYTPQGRMLFKIFKKIK